jgi:hypothetical protein
MLEQAVVTAGKNGVSSTEAEIQAFKVQAKEIWKALEEDTHGILTQGDQVFRILLILDTRFLVVENLLSSHVTNYLHFRTNVTKVPFTQYILHGQFDGVLGIMNFVHSLQTRFDELVGLVIEWSVKFCAPLSGHSFLGDVLKDLSNLFQISRWRRKQLQRTPPVSGRPCIFEHGPNPVFFRHILPIGCGFRPAMQAQYVPLQCLDSRHVSFASETGHSKSLNWSHTPVQRIEDVRELYLDLNTRSRHFVETCEKDIQQINRIFEVSSPDSEEVLHMEPNEADVASSLTCCGINFKTLGQKKLRSSSTSHTCTSSNSPK